MIKKILTTFAAAAIAVPAFAADYNLRAIVGPDINDEDYDGIVVFKDYVEAASNGAIEIEIFAGTTLCANGAECLQGIADGTLDVYISTSGGAAGIFPYVQVLDLPYLMSGDRVAEEVLSGDFTNCLNNLANICILVVGRNRHLLRQ